MYYGPRICISQCRSRFNNDTRDVMFYEQLSTLNWDSSFILLSYILTNLIAIEKHQVSTVVGIAINRHFLNNWHQLTKIHTRTGRSRLKRKETSLMFRDGKRSTLGAKTTVRVRGSGFFFVSRVTRSINPAEIYAKSPSRALFRPGEVKQGREESSLVAACVRLLDVPA